MAEELSLEVYLGSERVGDLALDERQRLNFSYTESWQASGYPISPSLPLQLEPAGEDAWQTAAHAFFENLLPEGQALDDACRALRVSKSSVFGLLHVMGGETSGALRVLPPGGVAQADSTRSVSNEELSARIRDRQNQAFSVWDNTVRISIAGYQDKLAVYQTDDQWALVDGPSRASTHILKPDPLAPRLAGLTSNEFLCMRLAAAVGLSVAPVRLAFVPEPVLVIERFDRQPAEGGVERLHVIDGCQALGLPASLKYERAFGDGRDVAHLRTGASLPALFGLGRWAVTPAAFKLKLLRWVLFQVLVQNFDAHAKNLSFFWGRRGLELAPAYDLLSIGVYPADWFPQTFAFAVGDAFTAEELSPYEWAHMAHLCDIRPRQLALELRKMALSIQRVAEPVVAEAQQAGADTGMMQDTMQLITTFSETQLGFADEVPQVDSSLFGEPESEMP